MDNLNRAAGDNRGQEMKKVAVVVVLGEIARSPRMRMHAESFAQENYFVHIISNSGNTAVPDSLSKNPSVHLSYVSPVPKALDKLPKLIAYVLKFAWQFISLAWIFLTSTFLYGIFPSCIMVQNPPSIPTLPLSAGDSSILTKVYKWAEFYFGSYGNLHLSVTEAMAADLKTRMGIEAIPFHDRPGPLFKPLSDTERWSVRKSFAGRYPSLSNSDAKILVSSTSWTEDEDFSILLSALHRYDRNAKVSAEAYPRLIVFITGKGPLKSYYECLIAKLDAEFVEIHLPWLEHDEYPQLLGCADLGVSLHTSSSGLDLPMKVVDMFGCGLPVAAIEFSCLSELVRKGDNGLIFNSYEELAEHIIHWFSPTKNQVNSKSEAFRKNLRSFHLSSWHTNWCNKVLPHLK